jgi:photosystem II stability/assembly factor-like uncharacterized protein
MDYGRRRSVSTAGTYNEFMGEITDQYARSMGHNFSADLKRPYLHDDFQSMMYLFDYPLQYLGGTPMEFDKEIKTTIDTIKPWFSYPSEWRFCCMSSDGLYMLVLQGDQITYIDPPTTVGAISLWMSDNYGSTWSEVVGPAGVTWYASNVCCSADFGKILLSCSVSSEERVYLSSDQGKSWSNITPTGISGIADWCAISGNGGTLFVVTEDATVLKSTNDGAAWTNITPADFDPGKGELGLINSSNDASVIALTHYNDYYDELLEVDVYENYVSISTDGGANWSKNLTIANQINHVFVSSDGTNVLAGVYGGLYVSSNSGATFTQKITLDDPDNDLINYAVCDSAGTIIYCCCMESSGLNVFYASYDNGTNWELKYPTGTDDETLYSAATSNDGSVVLIANGYYRSVGVETEKGGYIYVSQDSGQTWLKR